MEFPVECTHCQVLMTSWSVPGSPVRYYQCPFCTRTFSSHYGEVFRSRAGARMVERGAAKPEPPRGAVPMPTAEDIRWKELKGRATRWFARLETEARRVTGRQSPAYAAARARAAGRTR